MARSEAIWIAMGTAYPVAAFTVKYELINWLRRVEGKFVDHVIRIPDNPTHLHYCLIEKIYTVEELIGGQKENGRLL